jgi:hypothetical protein
MIAFIKEVNISRSSVFISSNLHLRVSSDALCTTRLLALQTKSTINRENIGMLIKLFAYNHRWNFGIGKADSFCL